jgi:ribonuclease HI
MAAGVKIFFDGGCRPDPHGMEVAVVIGGRQYINRNLGPGTSMDAEWLALIEAMRLAHELDVTDAVLLGDAAAVIAQANGTVRCPRQYQRHFETFCARPRPPGRVRIRYLKRTQNLAGIALLARRWSEHPRAWREIDLSRSVN